jgi:hypothetical protein
MCASKARLVARNKTLNPKYTEWNFEVHHSFGSRTAVSANYVGNRGYDEFVFNSGLNGFGFGGLPATAPDSRVATVTQLTNAGISNYNGNFEYSETFVRFPTLIWCRDQFSLRVFRPVSKSHSQRDDEV